MDYSMIDKMKHSPVDNYVIPGLTSWLIGMPSVERGTVRLFESSRLHQEQICPHSHRFDFTCLVLEGAVVNSLWIRTKKDRGDRYQSTILKKVGQFGSYTKTIGDEDYWHPVARDYAKGQQYSMKSNEVHSIQFSRGAKVLFFEGPEVNPDSIVLQPVVDGMVIPTFKVEPWMFKRNSHV